MIKIQQTEANDHRPAKVKGDSRVWDDIVVANTHEAALDTLIGQLNADAVDTVNKWFRISQ